MTMNGNTNPVEHQGGQSELEEPKKDKSEATKKTAKNRRKRENKKLLKDVLFLIISSKRPLLIRNSKRSRTRNDTENMVTPEKD